MKRLVFAAVLSVASAAGLTGCHNGNPVLMREAVCFSENGLAGPFEHWETVRDDPNLHAALWDQDHGVFQFNGTNACGSTLVFADFYFQRIAP